MHMSNRCPSDQYVLSRMIIITFKNLNVRKTSAVAVSAIRNSEKLDEIAAS